MKLHVHVAIFFTLLLTHSAINGSSSKREAPRYLLYTVNPGEGFNLRRDVHMRAATVVKELRKKDNWVLVLPPWPHLYHWKSRFDQDGIKWERFFDLKSLNEYVPSIEYKDYLAREGRVIDKVIHLQHFAEGWGEEGFREKYEERPCIEAPSYKKTTKGVWQGSVFLGGGSVETGSFQCVSVLGFTTTLLPLVEPSGDEEPPRSVLMERLEAVMHSEFGGLEYWAARYSMVYAQELRETGNRFMRSKLNYDPGSGNGRQIPKEEGGDFLSVHLRRRDYIHARPDKVPSLEDVAKQISTLLKENQLDIVFLCSDAPPEEKKVLQRLVSGLVWYEPTETELHQYGDGGVSIIDQWIAAHAKFFLGSAESTFSFRIREDRQFMKFSLDSTFNHLCGSGADPHSCGKPSIWIINEGVWSLFTHKSPHPGDEL